MLIIAFDRLTAVDGSINRTSVRQVLNLADHPWDF
jgi:hypothetical protein